MPSRAVSGGALRMMASVSGRGMRRVLSAFAPRENIRHLLVAPPSHFAPIDGLRALSILWVMLWHVLWYRVSSMPIQTASAILDAAPRAVVAGHYGVDVFFVISGFLIASILMREQEARGAIDVKRFYARRFLRLMPAYFFALAVYCLAGGANCDTVWANVLYVNNFMPGGRQAMAWAWSLAIEEQFYLVFPAFLVLVYYRIERRRLLLLCSLLALAIAIRAGIVYQSGIAAPFPSWRASWSVRGVHRPFLHQAAHPLRGAPVRSDRRRPLPRRDRRSVLRAASRCGRGRARSLASRRSSSWRRRRSTPPTSPGARGRAARFSRPITTPSPPASGTSLSTASLRPWPGPLGQSVLVGAGVVPDRPALLLGVSPQPAGARALLRRHTGALAGGTPSAVLYAVGIALTLLAAAPLYLVLEKPFMNLRDMGRRASAGGAGAGRELDSRPA